MSIRSHVNRQINESHKKIHTVKPARILEYDADTQRAKIEILEMLPIYNQEDSIFPVKMDELEFIKKPRIEEVPVAHYNSNDGKTYIHFPIKKGDLGQFFYSDRSIANYINGKGDFYQVFSLRQFDLNDGFFSPIIRPSQKKLSVSNPDALTLKNEGLTIEMLDGRLKISNSSEELISLLVELLTALTVTTTATLMGPQPFVNVAQYTDLLSRLTTFKE